MKKGSQQRFTHQGYTDTCKTGMNINSYDMQALTILSWNDGLVLKLKIWRTWIGKAKANQRYYIPLSFCYQLQESLSKFFTPKYIWSWREKISKIIYSLCWCQNLSKKYDWEQREDPQIICFTTTCMGTKLAYARTISTSQESHTIWHVCE